MFYGLEKEPSGSKCPPREERGFSGFALMICSEVTGMAKSRRETASQRCLLQVSLALLRPSAGAAASYDAKTSPSSQYPTWGLFSHSPKTGGSQTPPQMLSPHQAGHTQVGPGLEKLLWFPLVR